MGKWHVSLTDRHCKPSRTTRKAPIYPKLANSTYLLNMNELLNECMYVWTMRKDWRVLNLSLVIIQDDILKNDIIYIEHTLIFLKLTIPIYILKRYPYSLKGLKNCQIYLNIPTGRCNHSFDQRKIGAKSRFVAEWDLQSHESPKHTPKLM